MSARRRRNSHPEHPQAQSGDLTPRARTKSLDRPPGTTLLATSSDFGGVQPDAEFPNKRDMLEDNEIEHDASIPDETILENELADAVGPSTTDAEQWRTRFAANRPPVGTVQVVEDLAAVKSMMDAWPLFDSTKTTRDKIAEFKNAKALKASLKESKELQTVILVQNLANLLEQTERQTIIKDALDNPDLLLEGRQALGVVDSQSQRLEAVCLWKKITHVSAAGPTQSERDANHWDKTWTKMLYVSELTGAPWNAGWPTKQEGVSRAGTKLVDALKAKAEEQECDGIGLAGLMSNVDFYLKAGFEFKEGYSLDQRGFPPLVMQTRK